MKIIPLLKDKVANGTPYIGWSAGSNLCCPTICTTNDMPIVFPSDPIGLDLISFQINPHFTENKIPWHEGESRVTRIKEYLDVNKSSTVVGLREGSALETEVSPNLIVSSAQHVKQPCVKGRK